ncbi:hypothetical protein [Nocardia xishanensis]|uniref:Uncharacterized protein n=1 Tax=Nocardia xishanensis TaxID=238964 RepID=A0ABW7XAA6_9NOCA
MWWSVDDHVPIRCAAALVAAFVEDLGVHAGVGALLHVLAFGLAEAAEHAHHDRVGHVAGIEASAELGHPDLDRVGLDAGRYEAELLPNQQRVPSPTTIADQPGV